MTPSSSSPAGRATAREPDGEGVWGRSPHGMNGEMVLGLPKEPKPA